MTKFEVISDRDRALEFCRSFFPLGDSSTHGICLQRDGQTIAATLYQDFNGSNIWAHTAGQPGTPWMKRHYLHEIFKYPFHTLEVRRVSLWIDANNLASRRFAENLGFVHEATLRGAGRGGLDATLYCMFREWCRFA